MNLRLRVTEIRNTKYETRIKSKYRRRIADMEFERDTVERDGRGKFRGKETRFIDCGSTIVQRMTWFHRETRVGCFINRDSGVQTVPRPEVTRFNNDLRDRL